MFLDPSLSSSYLNLFVDYADLIPAPDQLLLLLHALGGSDIPEILLKCVRSPQRRWNAEGEIESTSAAKFCLPIELVNFLSDDTEVSRAAASPYVITRVLDDDTIAWSLSPEFTLLLSNVLLPRTTNELAATALKLICFGCPPCYEGNIGWYGLIHSSEYVYHYLHAIDRSPSLKNFIWPILERLTKTCKMQGLFRTRVLETVLFFAERDSVAMRHAAVSLARSLLRKSMPYYLHATVVLFRSTLYRVDGEFAKSEAHIREFVWRGPPPVTRRDHALQGRLHISQIENKIKCYDNDVPSFMYKWEAKQPLAALDIEVTFRLQSTAARFFQSVGDFDAARASLEQILSLDTTQPLRGSTRRVLVGRLADIYCEMKEYSRAMEMLQMELNSMEKSERSRRECRKLLLASVEANIGLGRLGVAESALKELEDVVPLRLDNLYDQQLHMRALLAAARIAHSVPDHEEAVLRWKLALQEVHRMYTLGSGNGFTAAIIHLSLAHAQLTTGDRDGGRQSWAVGLEILRSEICEFWLPIVPTVWLQKVASEVHEMQGWAFHMMLPGGRPNITWS